MKEFDGIGIVRNVCEYAKKNGADKAQVKLNRGEKYELNVDAGEMSLYRTTVNVSLDIVAHTEKRKGFVSINRYDDDSIHKAVQEAIFMAKSSEPDDANDISPKHALECFKHGQKDVDSSTMYDRISEFLNYCAATYPNTRLEQCILDFNYGESFFSNSNGAEFIEHSGLYNFVTMFTTKVGTQTSSFNYSGATHRSLTEKLWNWGNINELMRQSTEQINVKPVDGSFIGDLILTPDCLGEFLFYMKHIYLGDRALITGNSPWKDSLEKQVASPFLTVHSEPTTLEAGYSFTDDGFKAENCNIIEKGILKNFTLGFYGANKTKKPRCPSDGDSIVIQNGTTKLNDMIADVERGLLLGRFSGGEPSENGDFSGVAKNSYLIEKGKISRPVGETMIAGNLSNLFKDIRAVSLEEINFGSGIMPWILSGNVTISGK